MAGRVSNLGPLALEANALPNALCGLACVCVCVCVCVCKVNFKDSPTLQVYKVINEGYAGKKNPSYILSF